MRSRGATRCIPFPLQVLNFICNLSRQLQIELRPDCKRSVPESLVISEEITRSSAKYLIQDKILEGKSSIYIENRGGPKTEPLGTADSTGIKQDSVSLQNTY